MDYLNYVYGVLKNEYGNVAQVDLLYETKMARYDKRMGAKYDCQILVRNIGTKNVSAFDIGSGNYIVGREVMVEIITENIEKGNNIEKGLMKLFNFYSQRFRECHRDKDPYIAIPSFEISEVKTDDVYLKKIILNTYDDSITYTGYTYDSTFPAGTNEVYLKAYVDDDNYKTSSTKTIYVRPEGTPAVAVGQYRSYTIGDETVSGYIIADVSTASETAFLLYTAKIDFTYPRATNGINLSRSQTNIYRIQVPIMAEVYYIEGEL